MNPGFWQYKPPSIGDLPTVHRDSWNVIESSASIPYVPSKKSYFLEASSLLSLVSPALMRGKICPNICREYDRQVNERKLTPVNSISPSLQPIPPTTQPCKLSLLRMAYGRIILKDPFLFFQYWISSSKFLLLRENPEKTYPLAN